jgi:hypothetical protein
VRALRVEDEGVDGLRGKKGWSIRDYWVRWKRTHSSVTRNRSIMVQLPSPRLVASKEEDFHNSSFAADGEDWRVGSGCQVDRPGAGKEFFSVLL